MSAAPTSVQPIETALKVVMVGDSNVGKSQLSLRFLFLFFPPFHDSNLIPPPGAPPPPPAAPTGLPLSSIDFVRKDSQMILSQLLE